MRLRDLVLSGAALLSPIGSVAAQQLGPVGPGGGMSFSDVCGDVFQIRVREGYWIDAIQLVCGYPAGPRAWPSRGGTGGGESVFQLEPGERILAVSGSAFGTDGGSVYSVQFHTDRRSSPVYGHHGPSRGQQEFRFDVPAGARFQGLVGQYGEFLGSLGVLVGPEQVAGQSRSIASNTSVQVRFLNRTGGRVDVYWVDFEGRETSYGVIEPGAEWTQQTFATHLWRFRQGGSLMLGVCRVHGFRPGFSGGIGGRPRRAGGPDADRPRLRLGVLALPEDHGRQLGAGVRRLQLCGGGRVRLQRELDTDESLPRHRWVQPYVQLRGGSAGPVAGVGRVS